MMEIILIKFDEWIFLVPSKHLTKPPGQIGRGGMIYNTTSFFAGLKFSPNGKTILLSTNGSLMRLVDAFTGHPLQTFAGHLNNKGLPIDGCFSPDSKYVFAGSTDGRVHVWDTDTGFKVITPRL